MVVTDPIADMIIRIKNGSLAKKKVVDVRWSKIKEKIGEILVKEGYLKAIKVETGENNFKILKMELIYHSNQPALTNVKRISKPGKRVYKSTKLIPRVYNGYGFAIISTPKGVMTNKQAKQNKIGGEILVEIW